MNARHLRTLQSSLWLLGLGALTLLVAGPAHARPGGGHSYSGGGGGGFSGGGGGGGYSGGGGFSGGGGGSYSGGGGGGEFDLVATIFGVGIMFVFWVVGEFIKAANKGFENTDAVLPGSAYAAADYPRQRRRPKPPDWPQLMARDPAFSPVVFQDFVYQLYARVHEARGKPEAMASLAPYVVPKAREAIAQRKPVGAKITNVVVGSMQVTSLSLKPKVTKVSVRFESNVSTETAEGVAETWYLVERWTLTRAAEVQSKPPEQALALKCPNCGAPFESTDDQRCDYCGEVVDNGRFDWLVARTQLQQSKPVPPQLGGYAPEVGTDDPTLIAPSFAKRWAALQADDPKLDEAGIRARVGLIYERLNTAWVARDLGHARPFLSAGIQDYLQYWIEAYKRQGLVNILEDMQIDAIEFCKLTRDPFYDALTLRVFARGIDYTVREADDRKIGGSSRKPRRYSEYWTLIRGSGVRGEARDDTGCPNCGAPLQVNMAGNCEHCSAHLTRGEFDWVLSRIEQDESYLG